MERPITKKNECKYTKFRQGELLRGSSKGKANWEFSGEDEEIKKGLDQKI